MYRKLNYIILLLLFQYIHPAWAQQDGGMPGEFLRWGIGSRAMGLGRAYTALAENATSGYWNAAGLADDPIAYGVEPKDLFNLNRMKFAFSYFRLFEQTDLYGLSSAYSYNRYASFGLSLLCLSTDGIEMWDSEFDVAPSSVLSANKLAVLLSYACRFKDWKTFDVGATVKYVQQSFSSSNYKRQSNFGLDLALRWRPFNFPVYWGLNIQNAHTFISEMKLGEDKIPWSIRTGWAWSILSRQYFKWLVALDYEAINHRDPEWSHFRGGAEILLGNMISVRMGLARNEFHFGIGFSNIPPTNGLSIDLAHSDHKQNSLKHGVRTSIAWDGNLLSSQQWYKEAISDSNWGKGRSKGLLQKIIDQYPDPETVARCYARFGDYEYEKQNFKKACHYYDKVFQIAQNIQLSNRNNIYYERYNYPEKTPKVFQPQINHLIASIKLSMDHKMQWTDLKKTYGSYGDLLDVSIKKEWWFNYCQTVIYDHLNPDTTKDNSDRKLSSHQYIVLIDSPGTAASLRTLFHFDLARCLLDTCFSDFCFDKKNDTFNLLVDKYKKQAAMPEDTVKYNIPANYFAIDSIKAIANKFEIPFNKDNVPGFMLQFIIKEALKNNSQWSKAREIYQLYDHWDTKYILKDSMFNYYGAVIYHKNAELYNDTWKLAEESYKFLIDSTNFADSLKVIFKLNHAICQLNSEEATAEKSLRDMAMAIPEKCAKSDPLGVFVFNDKCITDDAQYCLAEYYCTKGDTDKAILEFAKIPFLHPKLDLGEPSTKRLKEILALLKQDVNPLGIADIEIDSSEYDITLSDASDIEVDINGRIYVSEACRQTIKFYNPQQNDIVSITTNSRLALPAKIALVNGGFYIMDCDSNSLHFWDLEAPVKGWLSFNERYINKISDIYSSGNQLYLLDLVEKCVFKKENQDAQAKRIVNDNLVFPVSIAIEESLGDIYIADWGCQGIARFNLNGTYEEIFNDLGEYCLPIFLRVDCDILNVNNKALYAIYWNLETNKKELVIHDLSQESDSIRKIRLNFNSIAIAINIQDAEFPLLVLEGGKKSRIKQIKIID